MSLQQLEEPLAAFEVPRPVVSPSLEAVWVWLVISRRSNPQIRIPRRHGSPVPPHSTGYPFQAFLYYGADSTLVTIASAYALLPSWHPRFDYHTDAFQHLRVLR